MSPTVPYGGCEHPERLVKLPGTVRHTGTVRVLVVEDERRLASAVRRGLTAEGFVVDVAHDGVDGLHLAREGGYDAVVLDLMLPGLSGYQVCERLRAERNWVPVLILSAKDGEYDQADGLDLGADDYMTKPFSYVVLAARLRARLTLATSAGLALALALAAVLLVNALRASLIRGLDLSARQGAVEVAALIDQNRLPSPVPVAPGTLTIQVLDASGRITNVSPGADRLVPMLPPAQARAAVRTGQARTLAGPPLGLPSLLRVVAVGAAGHHVVISAISFTQASDSLATLARVLAIGTPLLFGLLALATWLLTGYTLR